jgi:predicted MFS family arabinose efflux permease
VWGGFLFDRFGIRAPFVWAAALMMVAFAIGVAGFKQLDPDNLMAIKNA